MERLEVQVLVAEEHPIQRPKAAEGVGGEEDLLGGVVGHHGLRPVDHRRHYKGELVMPQIQDIPLLDGDHPLLHREVVELGHQAKGLAVAHQLHAGVAAAELLDVGAVVRLHVVDDQVVRLPVAQGGGHILQILGGHAGVGGVQNGYLLIQDHIAVVGYPIGHREHILKESQAPVTGADPDHAVGHRADILHRKHLPYISWSILRLLGGKIY